MNSATWLGKRKLSERDKTLGVLQYDLSEVEMLLVTAESVFKKAKGPKREQLREQRDVFRHEHDIQSLRVEIRETELNRYMKEEVKKQHINALRNEIRKGELAEAERLAKSGAATKVSLGDKLDAGHLRVHDAAGFHSRKPMLNRPSSPVGYSRPYAAKSDVKSYHESGEILQERRSTSMDPGRNQVSTNSTMQSAGSSETLELEYIGPRETGRIIEETMPTVKEIHSSIVQSKVDTMARKGKASDTRAEDSMSGGSAHFLHDEYAHQLPFYQDEMRQSKEERTISGSNLESLPRQQKAPLLFRRPNADLQNTTWRK